MDDTARPRPQPAAAGPAVAAMADARDAQTGAPAGAGTGAEKGAPAPAASPLGGPWVVGVRGLCEFTARHGDLDRRFTPTATALEGLQGQGLVRLRRGPEYEAEIALEADVGPLRVRGRADGWDPRRRTLEEVKTIRGTPEDIPANRRLLHWAQLQTYGALFCRQRGLDEVTLALVYFDIDSQTETELREVCAAADLQALLVERSAAYEAWAAQEAAHRAARDTALAALPFPRGAFREGQRELAAAVWRATVDGGCLLAQAPTGSGKTLGTLYPLLRAMPGRQLDKLAYLTCKNTGRLGALDALADLRDAAAGRPLRVLEIVAKDSACVHPDLACHGEACPLARGFHDRLAAARAQAVTEGWLDAAAQRRIAADHGVCPYYLGQELLRWADVVVGDVHHGFDPHGQLHALTQALQWRVALLVDEAHNLVERARQMYGAGLRLSHLTSARALAPAPLRPAFDTALLAGRELAAAQPGDDVVLAELPEPLTEALRTLSGRLGEHFLRQPLAVGGLLDFHFALRAFVERVDTLGEHSLVQCLRERDIDAEGAPDDDALLALHNVIPAPFLRPRWAALQGAVLFSATLGTLDYQRDLLGLPERTGWIDLPPVFPREHLQVRVAHRLSTRYRDRQRTLPALLKLITRQFDAHPGNYLAFFGGHDYLAQAAELLASQRPDIAQWHQTPAMDAQARANYLARFAAGGRGIGFALLGGVFAEGVDLPGARLVGAFIATLGLQPPSPLQAQVQARLERQFGADAGYADVVPAMQKVVQAAGRVLRTPEDRGWLWLLDERYLDAQVVRLLPPWWGLEALRRSG